ncbi:MAG TPA: cytochrome c [Phenylobacterium sp.]
MKTALTWTIVTLALAAPGLALAQSVAAKPPGEAVFKDNCAACHQLTGKGVPGAFPALAANKFVTGPPEAPTMTILMGRGGMPAFKTDLDDGSIANVLTYLRMSWGNKAKPVSAADVKGVRAKLAALAAPKSLQAH